MEFNRGAFPGATNIPLLNDEQRHLIGIRYKEKGQDKAIELGMELITPEIRASLLKAWRHFITKNPEGYLYCFRGGLRSRITQKWLAEDGIDYPLIPGGYKSLRKRLIEHLDQLSATLPFVLIGGRTGSGKTLLLKRLPASIDLEGLARHRGSSFGRMASPQPTTIDFENSLAVSMLQLAAQNPRQIYIEDEGKLIGRLAIPHQLRNRMLTLPLVLLKAPIERRIQVAETDYIINLHQMYVARFGTEKGSDLFAEHHRSALHRIRKRFGADKTEKSRCLFEAGLKQHRLNNDTTAYHPYISMLLTEYYDPMYDYQLRSKNRKVIFTGTADEVSYWARTRQP